MTEEEIAQALINELLVRRAALQDEVTPGKKYDPVRVRLTVVGQLLRILERPHSHVSILQAFQQSVTNAQSVTDQRNRKYTTRSTPNFVLMDQKAIRMQERRHWGQRLQELSPPIRE